jgi:hypothetical protein
MPLLTFTLALAAWPAGAQTRHFEIDARFEPAPEGGGGPVVAFRFAALDPDVNLNEVPAPRLRLEEDQQVLALRPVDPPAAEAVPVSADEPRYHDLSQPLVFPVEVAEGAPEGLHGVSADLVYFYCSTSQGWCRRGSERVTIGVQITR